MRPMLRGRRGTRVLAMVALLLSTAGAPLAAQRSGGYKVIVNAANPLSSLPSADLARLFLRRQRAWGDGVRVEPVDLQEGSQVRARFSQSVLHKSTSAIKAYWLQLVFSGKDSSPPELPNEAAVVDAVAASRGAVGYVSEDTPLPSQVRVLAIVN